MFSLKLIPFQDDGVRVDHFTLKDFEPFPLPSVAQRGDLTEAFDLGRCCGYSHWWSTAFSLSELGRYELGIDKNEIINSCRTQYHHNAEKVFENRYHQEQFEFFLLDRWGEITEILFDKFGDHFEENPEYLVFWNPSCQLNAIENQLSEILCPTKIYSLLLGFHFDTAIRNLGPIGEPSEPYHYLYSRFRRVSISDEQFEFGLEWVLIRDNLLRKIGVTQNIINDLKFETNGHRRYREMYGTLIRSLNFVEKDIQLKELPPGYLGLIVDKNRREIRRKSKKYEAITVPLSNDLWLIFLGLFEVEANSISGRELSQSIGREDYGSLRERISELRERLAPLEITVSKQKYGLIPLKNC